MYVFIALFVIISVILLILIIMKIDHRHSNGRRKIEHKNQGDDTGIALITDRVRKI